MLECCHGNTQKLQEQLVFLLLDFRQPMFLAHVFLVNSLLVAISKLRTNVQKLFFSVSGEKNYKKDSGQFLLTS